MVCSHCGSMGHNKRTCRLSPKTSEVPRSEKRTAKALAALLPPPNKSKKVSKPLEGLAGCQNIWKEPKAFYVAKKVSKPLEDISSCQNIWKEPKDFYMKQKCRVNTCSHCGGKGHNSRTCVLATPKNKTTTGRQCSLCGECGHNKRTCLLKLPEKKQKKCGICGEIGHNSRTCTMKCQPCSDQVTAEMSPPQVIESPPTQRKTECITFANDETINLDLGIA